MSTKPRRSRRLPPKRRHLPDNLDVFRDPPKGSTLEALAKEDREKEQAGPLMPDTATLRPGIVADLHEKGMPKGLEGAWLDDVVNRLSLFFGMTIALVSITRPPPSPDSPNIMLIAFVVSRLEAHQRRLYGAQHESADTSSQWVIENALVATAVEAGPGVSVANVVAAWRYSDAVASRSPDAATACGALRRVIRAFDAAKSPAGTWLPARDRKMALNAIDDQYHVDWRRRQALEDPHAWRHPDYESRRLERHAVNTRLRDLELRLALFQRSAPRRRPPAKKPGAK